MAEMRTFRSRRGDDPPTPFRLLYEVPETAKVNAGTEDDPDWQEQPTGNWLEREQVFHARHKIPAGVALDVSADPNDPVSAARQPRAIRRLIRLAVVEWEMFFDLLDDDDAVIDPADLGDIVNFLLEVASGRPTPTPKN